MINNKNYGNHIRKYNEYIFKDNYIIGKTLKGEEFYFNLEDYDKIKDYCWRVNNNGYLVTNYSPDGTRENRTVIEFHRFIVNKENKNIEIDHIDRNKLNNRRNNFRFITSQENSFNSNIAKNNTSGFIGVSWHKKNNCWISRIKYNYKQIYLGSFSNIDNAIKTRLEAELKFFGEEFAPQRHLFKQYGIN